MLSEQQRLQVAIQPQQVHQTFSEHYSDQQLVDQVEHREHRAVLSQKMAREVSLTSQDQQVKVDQEHREHREHREHQEHQEQHQYQQQISSLEDFQHQRLAWVVNYRQQTTAHLVQQELSQHQQDYLEVLIVVQQFQVNLV